MDEQQTSERFDLEHWLRVLRRRWWLILLCFVLAAGSAAAFSFTAEKKYTAKASLLFRDPELDQGILGVGGGGGETDPDREAATNERLVSSPAVAARTARALGRDLTPRRVSDKIGVNAEGQSNVVDVEAVDPSAAFAARLANTYSRQFIAFRRDADRAKIRQIQASVQRQLDALSPSERNSPAGRSLQTRVEQLDILASLQTGNAELVQPATAPTSPSSPKTNLNIAGGGFLGLLFGLGLALLFERLNRSVRESDELSSMYGLPLLAEIPESQTLADYKRSSNGGLDENEREAFRMLRARLRFFNIDQQLRSVLVTSCTSQEGKSTVAWHLASTMAMSSNQRVVLVEADLRRPTLALGHGLRPGPGLSDALVDNVPFTQVVQTVELEGDAATPAAPGLDVIVAGGIPPNPAELLESERMSELLKSLQTMYDFVVVDSAPTLLVADPLPLMKQVGGVIVVSRMSNTTRDAAARLRDQLRDLDAPVVGVIANRVKVTSGERYGYGYGYESLPPA